MNALSAPGSRAAAAGTLRWWLRMGLSLAFLNALLGFENRWPGFGVVAVPRLSFELCLALAALMAWVAWRGPLGRRQTGALALLFMALVALRYASVTAPAVLGRPVNAYWDGQHALELLRLANASLPLWRLLQSALVLVLGLLLLGWLVRAAIRTLAEGLLWPAPRPWLLALVGALTLSFVAYVPGQRDTRWFFSLPLTPTLLHQSQLLWRVALPPDANGLGESPDFAGGLGGLSGPRGRADVLLVFAESYGMVAFEQAALASGLAAAREELAAAVRDSGRAVLSARVQAPTFGGASWLSHAALLAGVDTHEPGDHELLLASERPSLVGHFARHGYRTVAWMPGLKRPWPEGRFYGFERLADDAHLGYQGLDFGYWRVPDQAALALLHAQELSAEAHARDARPRFVVFPSTSTHAPFHPLAPWVADWARLLGPLAYTPAERAQALAVPLDVAGTPARYRQSLRYQYAWLADYLRHPQRPLLLIVVGDHQPPGLVSGPTASWDVPVHVIGDNPALLKRLLDSGFVPGLQPPAQALGTMPRLTRVLLQAWQATPPEPGAWRVGAAP